MLSNCAVTGQIYSTTPTLIVKVICRRLCCKSTAAVLKVNRNTDKPLLPVRPRMPLFVVVAHKHLYHIYRAPAGQTTANEHMAVAIVVCFCTLESDFLIIN